MGKLLRDINRPTIRKRLESLHNELTKHNSYFIEISNESKQYLQTLQTSVPDSLQHTLFLYEDAQFSIRTVLDSKIYLQGFKDALYLFNELHISKN
ncbi:hypothetical protein QNH46_02530 [Paenibacillus woosongensis]|uniref:Uncharacterized protein n=1 Tax=Paenibacillus woosongensis TaxID=307580 RepID=A0AA95ICE0_9BACL|nr:hypothetical protein [Paenibacillus woosongensis]WHX51364.1 hypothetical protein QNH46_02530 [Paenibacillus woosongensis]